MTLKRRMKALVALPIILVLMVPFVLWWIVDTGTLRVSDWIGEWQWPEKIAAFLDQLEEWSKR